MKRIKNTKSESESPSIVPISTKRARFNSSAYLKTTGFFNTLAPEHLFTSASASSPDFIIIFLNRNVGMRGPQTGFLRLLDWWRYAHIRVASFVGFPVGSPSVMSLEFKLQLVILVLKRSSILGTIQKQRMSFRTK